MSCQYADQLIALADISVAPIAAVTERISEI